MGGDLVKSGDVDLWGKELLKKVGVEDKQSDWTKVQINSLMSALLQEAEDILRHAEQQCIFNRQSQKLVEIKHKRTELMKVAALPPDVLGRLNVIEVADCLIGFETQIAAYVQKGVVGDCMDKAMVWLKKCHKEVEGIVRLIST